jgi:hypothetical protein
VLLATDCESLLPVRINAFVWLVLSGLALLQPSRKERVGAQLANRESNRALPKQGLFEVLRLIVWQPFAR